MLNLRFIKEDLRASDIQTHVTGPVGEKGAAFVSISRQCKTRSHVPPCCDQSSFGDIIVLLEQWADGSCKCSLDPKKMSPDWAGIGITVKCWIITRLCGTIGVIVPGKVWLFPLVILIAWIWVWLYLLLTECWSQLGGCHDYLLILVKHRWVINWYVC